MIDSTLMSAIVVAALSGLTFLAYAHPKGYMRLYFGIATILIFAMFIFLTWNTSNSVLYRRMMPLIDENKLSEASNVAQNLKVLDDINLLIIPALIFYLVFLLLLPLLLGKNPEE